MQRKQQNYKNYTSLHHQEMEITKLTKEKKMKQGIYTIMDRVAGISAIVQIPSDEVAMRYFKNAFNVNNGDNQFTKNAADFVGCKLGTIETTTGEIEADYVEMLDCYDYLEQKKAAKNVEN